MKSMQFLQELGIFPWFVWIFVPTNCSKPSIKDKIGRIQSLKVLVSGFWCVYFCSSTFRTTAIHLSGHSLTTHHHSHSAGFLGRRCCCNRSFWLAKCTLKNSTTCLAMNQRALDSNIPEKLNPLTSFLARLFFFYIPSPKKTLNSRVFFEIKYR